MKTCSLVLVAVAAIVYAAVTPAAAIQGEWRPIPDIKDPRNQKLGAWAVAEHVKQANDGLRFSMVISGEVQVVSGLNYRLVIDALNLDGNHGTYKAEVYKQDWTNTLNLVSFGPAN